LCFRVWSFLTFDRFRFYSQVFSAIKTESSP
jgi:hypothetical protein